MIFIAADKPFLNLGTNFTPQESMDIGSVDVYNIGTFFPQMLYNFRNMLDSMEKAPFSRTSNSIPLPLKYIFNFCNNNKHKLNVSEQNYFLEYNK